MKIYLAGERAAMATTAAIRRLGGDSAAAIWTKSVKRRLFSFYYHGYSGCKYESLPSGLSAAIADSIEFGWDLFLDSGAFTAFTKGVKIDEKYLDEYAIFIERCLPRKIFTVYSSLDAIGQGKEAAEESLAKFNALRKRNLPIQPVFHVREPDEYLARYVADGHDYIFIGGMVPETTGWLRERLDGLWHKILTNKDGTAKVKTHGFGLTDTNLMFRYPWYSVDSSSWLMTGVFGSCMFRVSAEFAKAAPPRTVIRIRHGDEIVGGLKKVVFSKESPEARKDDGWHYGNSLLEHETKLVDSWLEPFGVSAEQLSQHYSFRDVVNAAVFQSVEDLGTDHFVNLQPLITDWENDE